MKFQRYEKYKSSGVDWLGEVPEGWEGYRINWINTIIRGNSSFKKDELLENGEYIALQYGKTYKVDEINETFNFYVNSEFYKPEQVVHHGNIILVSTSETIEDLGHTCFYDRKDLGLIGGEQILLKPKSKFIFEKYLYYYSKAFCKELRKYSTGLKVFRFNIDDLKKIYIPIPNKKTQTFIANYLDKHTSFIDQKIELLKAKKQSYTQLKQTLINEVVTKGLDTTVEMKDSGIEWIGQIPKHWEVKRFKEICYKNQTGGTPSTTKSEMFLGDNVWVTIADISNDKFVSDSKLKLTDEATKEANIPITPKNSLIYSFKLTLGKIAFAKNDLYTNEALISILPNRKIDLNYFYYMLPKFLLLNATENIYGAKMLNQRLIANALLIAPPKLEQIAIANYLDEKTSKIDKIIQTIDKSILVLQEYRKTLINDVVTGKVKII